MGRLIEGYWDCGYCSTTGIGGSKKICPNCGKARDKHTKFYLDKSHKKYVPIQQESKINRNPDWVCIYCNNLNSDSSTHCHTCGSPRTSENLNYFENRKEEENKKDSIYNNSNKTTHNNTFQNTNTTFIDTSSSVTTHPLNKPLLIRSILITLAIILAISGIVYLFIPKEKELTVQSFSWVRNIEIERYQTVNENDWVLPTNARLHYTRSEIHSYQNVIDHYETKTREVAKQRVAGYEEYVTGHRDLGNGYFEEITSSRPVYETYYETETYSEPVYRKEPIYKTKYYYEIDKWLYERTVTTRDNNQDPCWGKENLKSDERVSNKKQSYFINGIDKKEKVHTIELSYDDWGSLNIGQKVKLKISFGFGKIVE